MKTLKELGAKVYSGKIIQRLIVDPLNNEEVVDKERRTIVSKTVDEGFIDDECVIYNDYKVLPDVEKLTRVGDIIIKLAPPYRATIIDEKHEGMLVSSFCAIIRNIDTHIISLEYLVAYLNSDVCREKFDRLTMGSSTIAMLSNSKINDLSVPIPNKEMQNKIAKHFFKMIENKQLIQRIIALEEEKLASMIAGLEE